MHRFVFVLLAATLMSTTLPVAGGPALAGGIVTELPRLTYPDNSTVDTAQTCLEPTRVTPACADK